MSGVKSSNSGFSVQGMRINSLWFANDIVQLEKALTICQEPFKDCKPYGMMLNISKTSTMVFAREKQQREIESEWRRDTKCMRIHISRQYSYL